MRRNVRPSICIHYKTAQTWSERIIKTYKSKGLGEGCRSLIHRRLKRGGPRFSFFIHISFNACGNTGTHKKKTVYYVISSATVH